MVRMPAPTGFSARRWQRIIDAAGRFLDRWADVASACGWIDLDIFGCHPDCPDARFDCMGIVLLLDRFEVVGVDEGGADVMTNNGVRQRFYRRPPPRARSACGSCNDDAPPRWPWCGGQQRVGDGCQLPRRQRRAQLVFGRSRHDCFDPPANHFNNRRWHELA